MKWNIPTNSLRWRIQLWYGFLLLLAITGFCLVTLKLAWNEGTRQLDRQIIEKERMTVSVMVRLEREARGILHSREKDHDSKDKDKKRRPPFSKELFEFLKENTIETPTEVVEAFKGTDEGFFYFIIGDEKGEILIASENAPESFSFPEFNEEKGFEQLRYRGSYRESLRVAPWGIRSCFGKEITPEKHDMRRFMLSLGLFAAAFWLVGLGGGWLVAGKALRPIQKISQTATEIAGGDIDKRIVLTNGESELDQLGRVLNHTFDELQAAMVRQRQFTADASHELRTPLTVILSECQRMLKKDRTPEVYQQSLEVCLESGMRMRSLVEGLLLLARQENHTTGPIDRQSCRLDEVLKASIEEFTALAEEQRLEFHTSIESDVEAYVDEPAIRILINNLLSNAITHHPGDGRIQVALRRRQNGMVILDVVDDGLGIDPKFHDQIFERFFQVDPSRSGEYAHSGLGLALVKMIAENHGGCCSLESEQRRGSWFTVEFPSGMPDSL